VIVKEIIPKRKKKKSITIDNIPVMWAEIYSPFENRWLHVDCIKGLIDKPKTCEQEKNYISYIVAFTRNYIKDVTLRYARNYSRSVQLRTSDSWWEETLNKLSLVKPPEEADLNKALLKNDSLFPTSQSAYKFHPLYCIEKWIGKFEVIYPKEPILGYVGKLPIYPRKNLKQLHTYETWLKEGRSIKLGEAPVKRVAKRQFKKKDEEAETKKK